MAQTSVSTKGQVTIPKPVRRLLGIKPGDRVSFEVEKNQVVLKKVTRPNVLDFAGKMRRPSGFGPEKLREAVKKEVARRVAVEGRELASAAEIG